MLTLFGWTNKKKAKTLTIDDRRKARRARQTQMIAKTTPQMTMKKETKKYRKSLFDIVSRVATYDVGIDLGTANVLIYVKGKGLVLDEPGYVARDIHTKEVLAVGKEAQHMLGRTPQGVEVIRPVQAGVIADYDTTEFMLRYFLKSVVSISAIIRPRIVVCVPSGVTPVEKRAVLEVFLRAGAKKTVLIEEPLAAALGIGFDTVKEAGAMVVDIGGGTTDIAVVCTTGIVVSESLRLGGDMFNESIIRYIRRKRKLIIGTCAAEALKISIGTVDRHAKSNEMIVRGRDSASGLPKAIMITSSEIQRAVEGQVMTIIEGIKRILEKTPPELVADIADHGIVLTGGGALMDGLDRLITRIVGIATYLMDSPRYAVIKGTAKALEEMSDLRDSLDELQ